MRCVVAGSPTHKRDWLFEREDGKKIILYYTRSGKFGGVYTSDGKKYLDWEDFEEFMRPVKEIVGRTFEVKDEVKRLGFKWDRSKRAWIR